MVGIDEYPTAPLSGAVNDANAVANVLECNGDGSPNFGVRLLTAPSSQITRATLRGDIEQLLSGDCDIALFYFSGHGCVTSTGGVIVTPDFKKYDEGISMDDILTLANRSRAKDKVILLDCCHSGAFGTPAVTGATHSQLADGITVLTASRDYESAMEQNASGVFTSLVVDALQGGAADLRGQITPGGIYSYVDRALGAWDQRPVFKTNISRFTPLRSITPPIPLDRLRNLIQYFPSPEHELPLDPSFEPTSPNANQDNVKILRDLQSYESVGLVRPINEEHMYYAAVNSTACRLTALGYQYWRLVKQKRI